MRMPRRQPRQVYRVFDEAEFLTEEQGGARRERTEGLTQLTAGPSDVQPRGPAVPGRGRPHTARLGAALLLVLAAGAGAIALDAIAPFKRARHRPVSGSRLSSPPPRVSSARRAPGRGRGRTVRARAGRRRGQRGGLAPGHSAPGRTDGPIALAPALPTGSAAEAPADEFSFERRLAP